MKNVSLLFYDISCLVRCEETTYCIRIRTYGMVWIGHAIKLGKQSNSTLILISQKAQNNNITRKDNNPSRTLPTFTKLAVLHYYVEEWTRVRPKLQIIKSSFLWKTGKLTFFSSSQNFLFLYRFIKFISICEIISYSSFLSVERNVGHFFLELIPIVLLGLDESINKTRKSAMIGFIYYSYSVHL